MRRIADAIASSGDGYFVATVGIAELHPGGSNVVPGSARIVVDARAQHAGLVERFTREIDAASAAAAVSARTLRSRFEILSDGDAAHADRHLLDDLRDCADALGLKSVDMVSGAGHDAAFLAQICPMAMLFTPSRKGISHNPEEWTEPEALTRGANLLLRTFLAVDRRDCAPI